MIFCNLKANFTNEEITKYYEDIKDYIKDLVILPPFPYLHIFKNATIGSQDVSMYSNGSYTGEVSATMLKSLNVKYCLIGHSERRINFFETENVLLEKIKQALDHNLQVLYCIGENSDELAEGLTESIIKKEIDFIKRNNFDQSKIIIVYEPIWAIGSGKTPSNEQITNITNIIKNELCSPVIYGGSVNPNNINTLRKIKNIDGFLIGSASLNAQELIKIVNI